MTQDELNQLRERRKTINELAYTGPFENRASLLAEQKELDAQIHEGAQRLRQQGIEDAVKAKLKLGFAGPDSDFEAIWTANRERLLLEQMQGAAAQAEAESAAWLRKQIQASH